MWFARAGNVDTGSQTSNLYVANLYIWSFGMTIEAEKPSGSDLADENWGMLNRKSVSQFFLLAALSDRPQHGYQLRRSIDQCCPRGEPTDAMI